MRAPVKGWVLNPLHPATEGRAGVRPGGPRRPSAPRRPASRL